MTGAPVPYIDGDALARAPLVEIENAICKLQPGSTLRRSFEAVVGTVAVELIAGTVPDGVSAAGASRRGCDLLALLHGHRVKHLRKLVSQLRKFSLRKYIFNDR